MWLSHKGFKRYGISKRDGKEDIPVKRFINTFEC